VTDRPDFTESALTIPRGLLQAEMGLTTVRTGSLRENAFGELLMRVGITPKTELRVTVPSYLTTRGDGSRDSGLSDTSLGVKLQLSRAGDRLGLKDIDTAVILATTLPSGSRVYRADHMQPGIKLLAASALTDKVAVSSNLNYDYVSGRGARYSMFASSLSFGFGLTERIGAYVEYFGFYPAGSGARVAGDGNAFFVNGGVTYLVNNDLQLDARVGKGMNGVSNEHFIGIGVSRRY
jgi:hypothetical protein